MMLEVRNLYSGYGEINILWGIDLHVEDKEIVAIIGPNGAGKTTLLKTIAGILKPRQGKIIYKGEDITHSESFERVKKGIVLVPEGKQLFPHMKVIDNLMVGCYVNKCRNIYDAIEMVFELFPVLKERVNQKAGTLSGGEQQMLAIARALMSRPRLLLLDEPSQGLAPKIVQTIMDTIKKLKSDLNISVIIVEQYIWDALAISDRAYVMNAGKIVYNSLSKELLERRDLVSQLYLR